MTETIQIEIPAEEARRIVAAAAQAGMTIDEFTERAAREFLDKLTDPQEKGGLTR